MYATKGGWLGRQTHSLAKSNESVGRKSRIRRSKGERKEMVESFIKKHQSLNDGNFPSLNLTHKEVGGSFYKIREIVREIIQENRVLGPAKDFPEEQNADQLLVKYPLGPISTDPESSLSLSHDGSAFVPDQHQNTSQELNLIADGLSAEPEEQQFDKEQIINKSHVSVTNKECDEIKVAKTKVGEALPKKEVKEEVAASRTKVIQMADVIVETFPLRPVNLPINHLDGKSGELRVLNGTVVDKEVEKVDIDVEVKSSHNDKVISETKVVNVSNGTQTETTLDGTHDSTNSSGPITHKEVIGNKADVQLSGSSQKGNKPTLDRINNKSWEGASKNLAESETNPVLAIFKLFIAAFMKIWS
ncbi:hypothetical protein GH714_036636 [Hevea brasiliensis]|uniref:AT3G52170-like helix-turn-helix domain-containing protein n=1 Tax=Hevea brasiliensis TaxID=3981 RepID=A0A6A6LPZ8_HEVBR|nr:hypothetical protein GH714_036636 [Hevea brasiliensis]